LADPLADPLFAHRQTDAHGLKQAPCHTQEADLRRQSDLEWAATSLLDHPSLGLGKKEPAVDGESRHMPSS
jgi:hypothetical protein